MQIIMNKSILISAFVVMLACLFPVVVFAAPGWDRDTTWTWGYDPPEDLVLTGFRMYQDGRPVCDINGADTRIGSCEIILTKRSTPFTLTAVFASGEESPHSEAYVLIDWGPKPRIIAVTPK